MTNQTKTPAVEQTTTEATPQDLADLQTKYTNSLSVQHHKIMDFLSVAGNSLTTYEAAEMGWQHLPTKLSEIRQAAGILCDKDRLPNLFNRYTLSAEARKQWRNIRKVGGA